MSKAAIYARYSAGPNQTDNSIDGQIRECKSYCKKINVHVSEIYADKHISGRTDDRPEFQRMIKDAQAQKFDVLVVWKTDRLSRNKYDAVYYKRILKASGVSVHYAAENIPDGPEGIILESLMEGMAEYYSAELSQKVRRGMHDSAVKCKILGGKIPLGYKKADDGTFAIDPAAADVVRHVFRMYCDCEKISDILNYINSRGYRTCQGNQFTHNNVIRMIHNEKYIGIYKEAGVVVDGGVPAIIDPSTWISAQRRADERRRTNLTRSDVADYMLAGKLYCGHCGSRMAGRSGNGNGGKYYYYSCQKGRRNGCAKRTESKEYIETLVSDITKDYFTQDSCVSDLVDKLYTLQMKADDRELRCKRLNKNLSDVKKKISNLITVLENGMGTDVILQRLDELQTHKTTIESEIEYEKNKAFGLTKGQLKYFLRQFVQSDEEPNEEYKSRIISSFVHRVELFDDHISIFYNFLDNQGDMQFSSVPSEVYDGSHGVSPAGPGAFVCEPYSVILYNSLCFCLQLSL